MFPKLALALATKLPAHFKLLLAPVVAVIEKQPRYFYKDKAACHLYFQSQLKKTPNSSQLTKRFALWRLGHILQLVQFLSFSHSKSTVSNQLALKVLNQAEPKVVIFYLP